MDPTLTHKHKRNSHLILKRFLFIKEKSYVNKMMIMMKIEIINEFWSNKHPYPLANYI